MELGLQGEIKTNELSASSNGSGNIELFGEEVYTRKKILFLDDVISRKERESAKEVVLHW